jgi:hypothetical protein
MKPLTAKLQQQFPELRFRAGQQFSWSPDTGEIIYKSNATGRKADWSLLHETGHALLKHQSYGADYELLRLEIDAWERAKVVAKEVGLTISEDHIQDCLDTYRDWLYKRSICPNCGTKCLQQDDFVHYRCFNCHTTWSVTASRFGRAYRRRTVSIPQPATLDA